MWKMGRHENKKCDDRCVSRSCCLFGNGRRRDALPLLRERVIRFGMSVFGNGPSPAPWHWRVVRILRQFVLRGWMPLFHDWTAQAWWQRCQMHLVRKLLLWLWLPVFAEPEARAVGASLAN